MTFRLPFVVGLLVCLLPLASFAQKTAPAAAVPSLSIPSGNLATNSPTPLSTRVVHYEIDAKYDPKTHQLDGSETLTYHNLTGQPLDTFPFHLYLNAFQPKATWIHEAHRDGNFRTSSLEHWKPEDYGSNVVTSFEVVGMGDLTKQMQFISPDDGNTDDKTVFQVKLPRPVDRK